MGILYLLVNLSSHFCAIGLYPIVKNSVSLTQLKLSLATVSSSTNQPDPRFIFPSKIASSSDNPLSLSELSFQFSFSS